ncbi:MAG: hypothetical protein ACOY37_06755 [Pseudomonadota bacterium]
MGPLEHLDILTERTLQLAVVAERLDERSEAAVQATERAAQEVSSAAARLSGVGERAGHDAVQAITRDAAVHLQQAAMAAFAQARAALDAHALRVRELDASVQASCSALARSHRRWLVVAPALLLVGSLLAVIGTAAWVAKARADVAAHRRDAAILAALQRSDVALCGDVLCARVEGSRLAGGYRKIAPRK